MSAQSPLCRTVDQAVVWLNAHFEGRKWSRGGVYSAIRRGELPKLEIDGRIYVVDLEGWLAAKVARARREADENRMPVRRGRPVKTDSKKREFAFNGPRRFGTPARDRRAS